MKLFLLLLLLTVSCTDNKARKNVAMPKKIEWTSYDESKPYTKLSYSNSLDIMLITGRFYMAQEHILNRYLEKAVYDAVYWDSNNNTYYFVTNKLLFCHPIPVSNTNFVYALNNPNQIEPVFYPKNQEVFPDTKAPLLYIGDLSSPLERVYLDPTNQVYYIKKLAFFDTSIYEEMTYTNDGEYNHPYKMVTNKTPPIYPAVFTNMYANRRGEIELIPYLKYTNKNKQIFTIPTTHIHGDDNFYPHILYYSGGMIED